MDGLDKYIESIDPIHIIGRMWQSSGSRSHFIGTAVECSFEFLIDRQQWLYEKIDDKNRQKRYDFDVVTESSSYRIEVKTLSRRLSTSIAHKDPREVILPTGKKWITRARANHEDFDYLAMCLVNQSSSKISDFLFVSFKNLSPLNVKNTEKITFSREEKDWIASNYISSSVCYKNIKKHCFTITDLK